MCHNYSCYRTFVIQYTYILVLSTKFTMYQYLFLNAQASKPSRILHVLVGSCSVLHAVIPLNLVGVPGTKFTTRTAVDPRYQIYSYSCLLATRTQVQLYPDTSSRYRQWYGRTQVPVLVGRYRQVGRYQYGGSIPQVLVSLHVVGQSKHTNPLTHVLMY